MSVATSLKPTTKLSSMKMDYVSTVQDNQSFSVRELFVVTFANQSFAQAKLVWWPGGEI
jgi:hypothetical protein